jgi:hypothetical protein
MERALNEDSTVLKLEDLNHRCYLFLQVCVRFLFFKVSCFLLLHWHEDYLLNYLNSVDITPKIIKERHMQSILEYLQFSCPLFGPWLSEW